jgi:hypothetical protein
MSAIYLEQAIEHARLALLGTVANLGEDHEVTRERRAYIAELEMRADGSTLCDIGYTFRGGDLCDYPSCWLARAS